MKHSVEEITLKNGAKGLLVDVPNASVMSTRIQFRAGMRYAKKPELYEIAHVVEHLAFGANASFKDEQAYETEFTKNGAYHNAWTSDYAVCYTTECADFEWDRIMQLQQVAITAPRYNEEELKSEKGNVRAELTGYMNDYSRLLWSRLQKDIGEDVLDLSERIKTVNNIELKDIREHYRRTHTANNMRFVIAGKLKHRRKDIIKMLEKWDLKPGERFEVPRDDLHASDATLIRRKDASNITFGFSFVTPRPLEQFEIYAMSSLNHILTGTMSSKIFGQARKKGLVYNTYSSLSCSTHNSSWDFDGEVNLENAEELFYLIRSELTKVLSGELDPKDVEAAQTYALGRYQMGAQTVSQITDYYAENYFKSDDVELYDHMPEMIKNINKDTMVGLAREFADSGIRALVAVSSVEKAIISNLEAQLNL